MKNSYDVIIVGGGIAGAILAVILAKSSFKVAIIEALVKEQGQNTARTIVLSHGSGIILESLGISQTVLSSACPIFEIHISDQGQLGTSRIRAQEENIPALGYVLSADRISAALHSLLKDYPHIEVITPATFASFEYKDRRVAMTIEKNGEKIALNAELLVAADGQQSAVRCYQNIGVVKKDYQQVAIICNLALKRPHAGVAYERFTQQGPLAILPLSDKSAGLIWTVSKERVGDLLSMKKQTFLDTLQHQFGYRLGRFVDCGARESFNLQLIKAQQQVQPGLVLVGNAAHTLHPVAGQGLNLALRDLAGLAQEIIMARKNGIVLGDYKMLKNYLETRQADQEKVLTLTHHLVGIFSNSLLPMKLARSMGMMCLDRSRWLKKSFTRTTLGLSGKASRLACGMPLD